MCKLELCHVGIVRTLLVCHVCIVRKLDVCLVCHVCIVRKLEKRHACIVCKLELCHVCIAVSVPNHTTERSCIHVPGLSMLHLFFKILIFDCGTVHAM